jgi:phosphatidylserine decarboxylase
MSACATVVSSILLAVVLLVPAGVKWCIKGSIVVTWALVIGAVAGCVTSLLPVGGIAVPVLIDLCLIGAMTTTLLLWRFFRDPERNVPDDPNAIVAPADGTVIYVKKIEAGSIPESEKGGRPIPLQDFVQSDVFPSGGYLIGISMNFLNVHVNRSPVAGTISLLKHIKGQFLSLRRTEALVRNDRVLTVVGTGKFNVGVVQISSRMVRKIVSYLEEGATVAKGERIGAIRFGSQVDLLLPDLPSLAILTKVGEEVAAGESILARL